MLHLDESISLSADIDNMRAKHWLITLSIFSSAMAFGQNKKALDSIRTLLEQIDKEDQGIRARWDSVQKQKGNVHPDAVAIGVEALALNKKHVQLVLPILEKYGWIGQSKIGKKANGVFFLVLQHGADLETRKKYLPLLKEAVKQKEANVYDYATMYDRILTEQGLPQLYGTQLFFDSTGKVKMLPIKDEKNVDKRRKKLGMITLQEYLKEFGFN